MVKKGYKQTKVGVLPEDWAIKKLINLSDGGMQNGTFYEGSRKGTGVYFLNVGNLYQAAPIIPQTLGKFDASKDEIDRFRVKNGDLFFTRSSIVPSGIAYCNWYNDSGDNTTVFDSHVVRFKTDTDQVNPMYLYLQCVSQESRKYFISNAKVATMTTIDQAQIGNCLIPVPSLTEQKNIAEAISDADRIIRLLEKLIIKKKAIKQGAMQELLTGKRRLPGFSGEWSKCKLGSLGVFLKGTGISRNDSNSGNLPAVRYGELYTKHQNYVNSYFSHISKEVASNAQRIYRGDILFAASGETKEDIGKCSAIIYETAAYAGGDILIFRPTTQLDPVFMGTLLNMADARKQRAAQGQGDAVVHIHADALSSISIIIPNIEEQKAIAEILIGMDKEIELLKRKLEKYRQVKQGMMQQLLTGKIRLM